MFTLPNGTEIPEDDLFVWRAYEFRCIVHPFTYAACLHEEPPKSKNPNWRSEPWNRYPLCAECHDNVHTMVRSAAKEWLEYNRTTHFPEVNIHD